MFEVIKDRERHIELSREFKVKDQFGHTAEDKDFTIIYPWLVDEEQKIYFTGCWRIGGRLNSNGKYDTDSLPQIYTMILDGGKIEVHMYSSAKDNDKQGDLYRRISIEAVVLLFCLPKRWEWECLHKFNQFQKVLIEYWSIDRYKKMEIMDCNIRLNKSEKSIIFYQDNDYY